MPIELIDTHVHLDFPDFQPDFEAVIERAFKAGVTRMITIGSGDNFDSAERALKISEKFPFIWASVGIHPGSADTPFDRSRLRDLLQHPRVVAIGETGLDFFRDRTYEKEQYVWFRTQIELAHEFNKPLIIHSRSASNECLAVLQEMNAEKIGGVFHCYPEDGAFAKKLAAINFLVSVGGIVTFKKAAVLKQAVQDIPLSQIMLETDGPYLAPEPNRGKRCEPAMLRSTAEMIADLRGIALEEVAKSTTQTAQAFFKLS